MDDCGYNTGMCLLVSPLVVGWLVVGVVMAAALFALPSVIITAIIMLAHGGALCSDDLDKFCMWGYGMLFATAFWILFGALCAVYLTLAACLMR